MSNRVHPTAVVDPAAKLGTNNYIGPFVYIGPRSEIGSNNRFEGYCSISTPPEHRDCFFSDDHKGVVIGDNNVFREFVTINGGWRTPTRVGNKNIFLRHAHAGHDVQVDNETNISCDVLLGGHVIVQYKANIGLGAVIHQHLVIGAFSMTGMNSTVTRDVVPFSKTYGNPASTMGVNLVGLERGGIKNIGEISQWVLRFDPQIRLRENSYGKIGAEIPSDLQVYVTNWEAAKKSLR